MTDTVDHLHAALAKAQAEMANAKFDSVNPHFRSKYASLAAIRDAVTPALSKYGLSLNHETKVREDGSTILVGVLAHGESGQQQRSDWLITGETPQARGSELTYGRRYTACCLTGIVGEADDDANAAEGEAQTSEPPQLSKARSRTRHQALLKEMHALTTKDALTAWALENTDRIYSMNSDFQRYFRTDYADHLTALKEGANEDGSEVKQDSEFMKQLRESKLREEINDDIPAEGGGDAA